MKNIDDNSRAELSALEIMLYFKPCPLDTSFLFLVLEDDATTSLFHGFCDVIIITSPHKIPKMLRLALEARVPNLENSNIKHSGPASEENMGILDALPHLSVVVLNDFLFGSLLPPTHHHILFWKWAPSSEKKTTVIDVLMLGWWYGTKDDKK